MTSERSATTIPLSSQSGRHVSPSPLGLRQRPLGRAATFAEGHAPLNPRRNSFLSETLSETRKSLRSSTDHIILPRAREEDDTQDHDVASHWHSLPLALALFPAIGGIFFQNGSAFITDVTLLALAAIFMNWSLRSPWDWYHASQSSVMADPISPSAITPIDEQDEDEGLASEAPSPEDVAPLQTKPMPRQKIPEAPNAGISSAQRELRVYEITALVSCFACPVLAAWLLHAIRSQLTRPSEGLVSNYNLTIFILVAEVRPMAHLIKLVQRRTLFLQRRANADALSEVKHGDSRQLLDTISRLDELELHVADRIAGSNFQDTEVGDALAAKASVLATSEARKTVQPELDALNRAMRRYEKRTAISSVQIEARIQDLEIRLQDVVVIAAAVQRNADRRSGNYATILIDWVCAGIVLPVQFARYVSSFPAKLTSAVIAVPRRYIPMTRKSQTSKEHRQSRKGSSGKAPDREKRPKQP